LNARSSSLQAANSAMLRLEPRHLTIAVPEERKKWAQIDSTFLDAPTRASMMRVSSPQMNIHEYQAKELFHEIRRRHARGKGGQRRRRKRVRAARGARRARASW